MENSTNNSLEIALNVIAAFCGISMFGNSLQYTIEACGRICLSVYTMPEFDMYGERAGSVPPSADLLNAINKFAASRGLIASEWIEVEKGWGDIYLTPQNAYVPPTPATLGCEVDDFDAWADERAREYEEERDAIACLSSF